MINKILELINNNEYKELKLLLNDINESDLSEIFDELDNIDTAVIFRLLDKDIAADVFSRMESSTQEKLIDSLKDNEIKDITSRLFADDAADMISEMPANLVKRILKNTDASKRKDINELLQYPEDSAGSIMTIEFTDLRSTMTVKEAFDRIRSIGDNKETIYTCYVIDNTRKLVGVVTVKDLLLASYETKIEDIMETGVITINTHEDKEEVAKMFDKYDFLAMPVVDMENRLVGIVTVDDAMDVMNEEASEDFEIMAAMTPSEDSYFNMSVFEHTKNRIVWLLILMLSAAITGSIINHYQNAFSSMPILVAFIPMLMGTGGNCGSQTSTLIIRGLATGEIELKDVFKCWFKEIRVALLVGIILSGVSAIRIMIQYQNITLAITVGIALIATVAMSKSLGCLLPLAAKKLKLDPAIMAAPLITTIVDTCSILIYFNVAVKLFGI